MLKTLPRKRTSFRRASRRCLCTFTNHRQGPPRQADMQLALSPMIHPPGSPENERILTERAAAGMPMFLSGDWYNRRLTSS